MKTRTEGNCEYCGKSLIGEAYEDTESKQGHSFCNYECMEEFYENEIPESEDFLIVPE